MGGTVLLVHSVGRKFLLSGFSLSTFCTVLEHKTPVPYDYCCMT